MGKKALIYGLIAGVIVSTIMVISMFNCSKEMEGGTGMMMMGFASMFVAFSMIFVGVRSYRNNEGGGYITFGKAFTLGIIIAFIASTMYVVTWMIDFHFFIPDFADRYAAAMLAKAEAARLDAAKMAAKVKEMDDFKIMYKNPVMVVAMTYAEILPLGLVVALVCALIYKKKGQVSA